MPAESTHHFREFTFDADTGELSGPSGPIALEPQPARVLALLLARRGELVTRKELQSALWADRAVEADQGINYCIRQIRAALGDTAESERFVQTFPRRGYKFVAPAPSDLVTTPAPELAAPVFRRERVVAALALVVLIAIVVGWRLRAANATGTHRLAILPLTSDVADTSWVAVNAQLSELLVEQLSASDSPFEGVVGPATTAPLTNDPRPHTTLGRALQVDYVLSGGVRPRDSTVFVQIVRVRDGAHVFARRWKVNRTTAAAMAAEVRARARAE